jgi:ribosome biogenesis GTPase
VIAAHGRHYLVAPEGGGAPLQCFPRGKKSEVAVGDIVQYEAASADQGVIVDIDTRRNLLYRSDQFKSKLFAANLDQLMIVLATEPYFSEDLLGRALVAADAHGLDAWIVLNKVDVAAELPAARIQSAGNSRARRPRNRATGLVDGPARALHAAAGAVGHGQVDLGESGGTGCGSGNARNLECAE